MATSSVYVEERSPAMPELDSLIDQAHAPNDRSADARKADFFEQPVPRAMVHRAAVAEVLLTRFLPDGQDTFLIGAQWPRGHSFYRVSSGYHDPMLLAETVRQAGLMISHVGYGVPLGHSFIMRRMTYDISPRALRCGAAPANVKLRARCGDLKYKGDQVIGLAFDADVLIGGESVGTGHGRLRCVSPEVYRRMRARATPAAGPFVWREGVRPGLVGRNHIGDVLLSPTSERDTWLLRCDPTHPVLFDHPLDHVPGMAMIEAARQAVLHLTHPSQVQVIGMVSTFHRYAELDARVEVRAALEPREADGTQPVTITMTSDGAALADITMRAAYEA